MIVIIYILLILFLIMLDLYLYNHKKGGGDVESVFVKPKEGLIQQGIYWLEKYQILNRRWSR